MRKNGGLDQRGRAKEVKRDQILDQTGGKNWYLMYAFLIEKG